MRKRYLRGSTSRYGAALPFTQMVSPKNSCIHMGCVPFCGGGYKQRSVDAEVAVLNHQRNFIGSAGKIERIFFVVANEIKAGQSGIDI